MKAKFGELSSWVRGFFVPGYIADDYQNDDYNEADYDNVSNKHKFVQKVAKECILSESLLHP